MNGQIQYGTTRGMTSTTTVDTDTDDSALAETRASNEALALAEQIAGKGLPTVTGFDTLPPNESCHFLAPVRFGRRRADQFGHLELTSTWMRFHGALDVSVVWSQVATVTRSGHDIVISLDDSTREFRFWCYARSEAARGGVIASYLANVARQARL